MDDFVALQMSSQNLFYFGLKTKKICREELKLRDVSPDQHDKIWFFWSVVFVFFYHNFRFYFTNSRFYFLVLNFVKLDDSPHRAAGY